MLCFQLVALKWPDKAINADLSIVKVRENKRLCLCKKTDKGYFIMVCCFLCFIYIVFHEDKSTVIQLISSWCKMLPWKIEQVWLNDITVTTNISSSL